MMMMRTSILIFIVVTITLVCLLLFRMSQTSGDEIIHRLEVKSIRVKKNASDTASLALTSQLNGNPDDCKKANTNSARAALSYDAIVKFRGFQSQFTVAIEVAHPGTQRYTYKAKDRILQVMDATFYVLLDGVPGDIAEFGVWKGGASIAVAKTLFQYAPKTTRKLHLFDSFEGHPDYSKTKEKDFDMQPFSGRVVGTLGEVKTNFAKFNLTDRINAGNIVFHKGWHNDTVLGFRETLSLVLADSDSYTSTTIILNSTWPLLSVGGYIFIDDYHDYGSCRNAVHDFMIANRLGPQYLKFPHSLPGDNLMFAPVPYLVKLPPAAEHA